MRNEVWEQSKRTTKNIIFLLSLRAFQLFSKKPYFLVAIPTVLLFIESFARQSVFRYKNMGAKGLLQPKRLPSTGGRGAVRHSLHTYLQILHDSIAQQSSSLSPTDFDWKRDGGWEEFEPIGSWKLLIALSHVLARQIVATIS